MKDDSTTSRIRLVAEEPVALVDIPSGAGAPDVIVWDGKFFIPSYLGVEDGADIPIYRRAKAVTAMEVSDGTAPVS